MNKFSELTIKYLEENGGYYVYGLIDPRNNKLFYIGKGSGNRVFQHTIESKNNPDSEKMKLKTIKSIEESGNNVKHILICWGITEKEAFLIEASLINLIEYISPKCLYNEVSGHHVHECVTAEYFDIMHGAKKITLEDFQHPTVIVKINKTFKYGMTEKEIYDISRASWAANFDRIKKAKYVVSIYHNLIVGCFKPDMWYRVDNDTLSKLPSILSEEVKTASMNRSFFECKDITKHGEVQDYLINKSIENISYIQKSQSSILYVNL